MRRGSGKKSPAASSSQAATRGVPGSVWDDQFLVDPNKPEKIGRFEEDSESTHSEIETPALSASDAASSVTNVHQEDSVVLPPDDSRNDVQVPTQPANPGGDPTDWRSYVVDTDLTIPITSLRWDYSAEKGQIRPLRQNMLNYYVQRLIAQGEPVKPIKLFVKKQQGVYFYMYADIFVIILCFISQEEPFSSLAGSIYAPHVNLCV